MTPPQTVQVPTGVLPRTRPRLRPFPLSLDRSFMFLSRPPKFHVQHTARLQRISLIPFFVVPVMRLPIPSP